MKAILFLATSPTDLVAYPQSLPQQAAKGYVFDNRFESDDDHFTSYARETHCTKQLGGALECIPKSKYCFEVQYLHQTTEVPSTYKLTIGSQTRSETPTRTIDAFRFSSVRQLPDMSGQGYGRLLPENARFHARGFDNLKLDFQEQIKTIVPDIGTNLQIGTVANTYRFTI